MVSVWNVRGMQVNFATLALSVYGEEAALAAIRTGTIQVLQIALSLLDQRMREKVIPEDWLKALACLIVPYYSRGTLTKRAQWLP